MVILRDGGGEKRGTVTAASPFQGIFIMEQILTDFWRENPRAKASPDLLLKPLGMRVHSHTAQLPHTST